MYQLLIQISEWMSKWWISWLNMNETDEKHRSKIWTKNNLLFFFNIENKLILPSSLMERIFTKRFKEILLDLLWVPDNYLVIIFPKIKFLLRNYLYLLNMLKLKVNQKTSFHRGFGKNTARIKARS